MTKEYLLDLIIDTCDYYISNKDDCESAKEDAIEIFNEHFANENDIRDLKKDFKPLLYWFRLDDDKDDAWSEISYSIDRYISSME